MNQNFRYSIAKISKRIKYGEFGERRCNLCISLQLWLWKNDKAQPSHRPTAMTSDSRTHKNSYISNVFTKWSIRISHVWIVHLVFASTTHLQRWEYKATPVSHTYTCTYIHAYTLIVLTCVWFTTRSLGNDETLNGTQEWNKEWTDFLEHSAHAHAWCMQLHMPISN